MSKIKIYCNTFGGIGNKVMSLASIWRVANKIQADVVPCWSPDSHVQCTFDQLFTNNFEIGIGLPDMGEGNNYRIHGGGSAPSHPGIDLKGDYMFCLDKDLIGRDISLDTWKVLLMREELQSCNTDYVAGLPEYLRCELHAHLNMLSPVEEVKDRVEAVLSKVPGKYLAIHMRETQLLFERGIRSDVEEMVSFVKESDLPVVVCSDNAEALGKAKGLLGDRFFSSNPTDFLNNVYGGYSSYESSLSALADMYLLARSEAILINCYSSFSMTSGILGQTPVLKPNVLNDKAWLDLILEENSE